jgi:hypothetical protein
MVMVAEADFVVSVTDVAVTVTVLGLGIVVGAVYVVAVPLAVDVGLKEPHDPPPPQLTVQVTPPFLVSLVTTAVRLVVAPTASDVGGVGVSATEIAGAD